MTRLAATLLVYFYLAALVHAHPADWFRRVSGATRDDSSWLWGWAWAVDGTVSIVDRSPAVTFPARPASFGLDLADPLLGYVIPLSAFTAPCSQKNATQHYWEPDPVSGCPELCVVGDHEPEPNESWIALVQRGGCPFVEKARQAQRLGAKAVVVGGDRENPDALLNMYSERDASDVTIAATYIRYWDYLELSALIAASNTSHSGLRTLSLLLSTEYSAWEWYSPLITFMVILLLPSVLTFLTLLIHRVRAARAAQRDRAPESIVHSFPWRVWTGSGWEKHEPSHEPAAAGADADVECGVPALDGRPRASTSHDAALPGWAELQLECAICLEMFAKGDRVRVLPCFHMFHMDEVDEWLINKKKLCPVCKRDVTQPPPEQPHPHSQSPVVPPVPLEESSPILSALEESGAEPSARVASTERTPLLQNQSNGAYSPSSS